MDGLSSNILIITSTTIFIPTCIAILLKRWCDVAILVLLTISCTWYHNSYSLLSFYFDQLSILILLTHAFLLAITDNVLIFFYTFGIGYVSIVYFYGKRIEYFCFDKDLCVGNIYHASLHVYVILFYFIVFWLSPESIGIFQIF